MNNDMYQDVLDAAELFKSLRVAVTAKNRKDLPPTIIKNVDAMFSTHLDPSNIPTSHRAFSEDEGELLKKVYVGLTLMLEASKHIVKDGNLLFIVNKHWPKAWEWMKYLEHQTVHRHSWLPWYLGRTAIVDKSLRLSAEFIFHLGNDIKLGFRSTFMRNKGVLQLLARQWATAPVDDLEYDIMWYTRPLSLLVSGYDDTFSPQIVKALDFGGRINGVDVVGLTCVRHLRVILSRGPGLDYQQIEMSLHLLFPLAGNRATGKSLLDCGILKLLIQVVIRSCTGGETRNERGRVCRERSMQTLDSILMLCGRTVHVVEAVRQDLFVAILLQHATRNDVCMEKARHLLKMVLPPHMVYRSVLNAMEKGMKSPEVQRLMQMKLGPMQATCAIFQEFFLIRITLKKQLDETGPQFGCAFCSKSKKIAELKRCSGCELVYYCSIECQKSDWKSHCDSCEGFASVARERGIITLRTHDRLFIHAIAESMFYRELRYIERLIEKFHPSQFETSDSESEWSDDEKPAWLPKFCITLDLEHYPPDDPKIISMDSIAPSLYGYENVLEEAGTSGGRKIFTRAGIAMGPFQRSVFMAMDVGQLKQKRLM